MLVGVVCSVFFSCVWLCCSCVACCVLVLLSVCVSVVVAAVVGVVDADVAGANKQAIRHNQNNTNNKTQDLT